jgi:hypothetical protein
VRSSAALAPGAPITTASAMHIVTNVRVALMLREVRRQRHAPRPPSGV